MTRTIDDRRTSCSRRALLGALLAAASTPALCAASKPVTIEVVDVYGRTVTVPSDVKRIVCTGNGALRLATYLQAADLAVGVEMMELKFGSSPIRDYAYVERERFRTLPIIGKGGGGAYTADAEAIARIRPDVIFTGYTREAAEQLARELDIPVVCTHYLSRGFIDKSFDRSLQIVARILRRDERAQELLTYIESVRADLKDRSRRDPPKASTYAGAVTFSGARGFTGTYSDFGPLSAVGARHVADTPGREGFYETSLERILEHDPDVIFLDSGNLALVAQDWAVRRPYYEALSAVRRQRVYAMPSFNHYSTNITYALMNAYYAGTILSPAGFADIDFARKCNEILAKFLGRGYFGELQTSNLFYGPVHLDGTRR